MDHIKRELYKLCQDYLQKRIDAAQQLLGLKSGDEMSFNHMANVVQELK